MSPSSADPRTPGDAPRPPRASLRSGRFQLEIGATEGIAISEPGELAAPRDEELAPALVGAENEVGREDSTIGVIATDVLDQAEEVTDEVERASELFATLAKGAAVDPTELRAQIDPLLDRLAKLDRSGRLAEALRLARVLERLLALTRRWRDLGRTLATAARAARRLGDQHGAAWVRHELGTLRLATGDYAASERHLEAARRLRLELGDRVGLAVTEGNLRSLCHELRRAVREEELGRRARRPRPVLLAAGAVALLIAGGVAGAVIAPGNDTDNVGTSGEVRNDEADPTASACADGADNDEDGLIDLEDPGCASEDDDDEADSTTTTACVDGADNDDDGLIDLEDPGCASEDDDDEADPVVD